MVLRPANLSELTAGLAAAHAKGETADSFDLAALNRLLEHTPEDMTATVETGMTLGELQERLAARGQWLPLDPPGAAELTLGALLATNATGPRRFGYGTVRDYLLGVKVALADGTLIAPGGKVVKNVAGYDLAKLFVGSGGSLGVIAEATFKLRPLPETERFVQAQCESLDRAGRLLEAVLSSDVTPVVLDLHNLPSAEGHYPLVVGFAGTREDVDWQLERAAALGLSQPATLDYEREFWNDTPVRTPSVGTPSSASPATTSVRTLSSASPSPPSPSLSRHNPPAPIQKISVLPSRLIETLQGLCAPFVARAGNGIVYYRGAPLPKPGEAPSQLSLRLKQTWDPKNILPPTPA
jgi:FAD/FMN-containing dehydrogenase